MSSSTITTNDILIDGKMCVVSTDTTGAVATVRTTVLGSPIVTKTYDQEECERLFSYIVSKLKEHLGVREEETDSGWTYNCQMTQEIEKTVEYVRRYAANRVVQVGRQNNILYFNIVNSD